MTTHRWSRPVAAAAAVFIAGLAAPLATAVGRPGEGPDENEGALREAPSVLDPREVGVGELVADFEFTDIAGEKGRLRDYAGKTLALVVRSTGCPVCKKYAPELARIESDYAARGVQVLYVNPMEQDSIDEMKAAVKRYGFEGRYIADEGRAIARALGAQTTTEVFVLDAARTLVYRGAVDDQYGLGYVKDEPQRRYLREALDAALARRRPAIEATWAPGCRLNLEPAASDDRVPDITYHGRISRIIQRNCQECHRPGMSGPFTLMNYEEVKGNADMIAFMVEERAMPPWFANEEKSKKFLNDRSLAERDRADLLAWVKAGCPEGDAKDAPVEREWPRGWVMGKPDAVLTVDQPIQVPAEGTIPYKNVWVETNFDEDKWIKAMEVQGDATEQLHHVLVFIRYPRNHPARRNEPKYMGGLSGYFAAMVPGQGEAVLADDMGKFLPKGARLRFQIHYTSTGTAAVDRPRIGLIFHEQKPKHEMRTDAASNYLFRIPPNRKDFKIGYAKRFRKPTRLLGFLPHMHLRGVAFRYTLIFPDGREDVVLDIPAYDFNWQLHYRLAEPIDCPPGTKLRAEGTFDNSSDNPANPDPSKWVTFGEQTWDEMMIGYYDYIELDEMPASSSSPEPRRASAESEEREEPAPAEKEPAKKRPVY